MFNPLLLQIENAIVERLTPVLNIPVTPFPDDPQEWKLKHPNGYALVIYTKSRWKNNGSSIDKELLWKIGIVTRNLRTHTPGYYLIEAVENILQGWFPFPDDEYLRTTAFEVLGDRFVGRDNKLLWYWEIELLVTVTGSVGGTGDDTVAALDDFLRWRDKVDVAPLNDEDTTPVADYEFFDAEDHVDLTGPD